MSIMICEECEKHVDTDFFPMSDDGRLCEACESEDEEYTASVIRNYVAHFYSNTNAPKG